MTTPCLPETPRGARSRPAAAPLAVGAVLLLAFGACRAPEPEPASAAPEAGVVHDADGLPVVGSPAPTWEAVDHEGRRWSSDALRGERYLVWFYPKAMTPG